MIALIGREYEQSVSFVDSIGLEAREEFAKRNI